MSEQKLSNVFQKATSSQKNLEYLSKLLHYGRTKGFENFINRKLIWPFLLGVDDLKRSGTQFQWDGEMDRNSTDYQQLQKDAERALATMKTFENITKFHLQKRQKDVLKILDCFFAKNKSLRYIQGFHDVASVFIVLFGNNQGYYLLQRSGQTYFRDFLTNDIGKLGELISSMVLSLLTSKDPQFERIFESFRQTKLIIFIIPWVLTWFAHVFASVKTICRIWDYILCTGPQGIVYLTAGMILSTKEELLENCPDLDQASIHMFYQEKAKNESMDIQKSIKLAIQLQESLKIQQLPIYKSLDASSMFRLEKFESKIDIHRQVRQYTKVQAQKERQRKIVISVGVVTVSLAAIFWLKWGKKLF